MKTTITKVSGRYGAPMGRPGKRTEPDIAEKIHLRRVRIDSQGYDSGGAYWGIGIPLWEAFDGAGSNIDYFRAKDRDAAKRVLLEMLPEAKFYR